MSPIRTDEIITSPRRILSGVYAGGSLIGGVWSAGAQFVNPAVGTVLIDTSPIRLGGKYVFSVSVSQTSGAVQRVEVQRRNTTNTTTLQSFLLLVGANSTLVWNPGLPGFIGTSERLRVVVLTAIGAGNIIQASLFWVRVVE